MEAKRCQFCLQEIAEAAMVCNYCAHTQVKSEQIEKYVEYIANQRLVQNGFEI